MPKFIIILLFLLFASTCHARKDSCDELFREISERRNVPLMTDFVCGADIEETVFKKARNLDFTRDKDIANFFAELGYNVIECDSSGITLMWNYSRGGFPEIRLEEARFRTEMLKKYIGANPLFQSLSPRTPNDISALLAAEIRDGKLPPGKTLTIGSLLPEIPQISSLLYHAVLGVPLPEVLRVREGLAHIKDNPAKIFWKQVAGTTLPVASGRFGTARRTGAMQDIVLNDNQVMRDPASISVISPDGSRSWSLESLSQVPQSGEVQQALVSPSRKTATLRMRATNMESSVEYFLKNSDTDVQILEKWMSEKKISAYNTKNRSKSSLVKQLCLLYNWKIKNASSEKPIIFVEAPKITSDTDAMLLGFKKCLGPEYWEAYKQDAIDRTRRLVGETGLSPVEEKWGTYFLHLVGETNFTEKFNLAVNKTLRNELIGNEPNERVFLLNECSDRVKDLFGNLFYNCLVQIIARKIAIANSRQTRLIREMEHHKINFDLTKSNEYAGRDILRIVITNPENSPVLMQRTILSQITRISN